MTKPVKHNIPSGTKLPRRAPGRPRQFDEARALAAARGVFVDKGLAATTLDDLTDAMQINRPSLYGAFTDKETLYLKTIDGYAAEMVAKAGAALAGAPDIKQALKQFYAAALDVYTGGGAHPVGCFIVTSAVPEAVTNPRIASRAADILRGLDAALEHRLRRAVEDGQLPRKADPASLAAIAGSILHSLAVRARTGERRKALDTLAVNAVRMITAG
jgi:AcrR family transcriptional regulator